MPAEPVNDEPDKNFIFFDLPLPAAIICLSITGIIIVSILIFILCRFSGKLEPESAPLSPSGPGYSSNLNNVDNLKLCAMIGQGKYGTVWKGMINEQPVAVKIFPSQYKQYFLNERDIYTTPLMDSPSLLQYFGCDQRRNMDDHIEYLLVLSLAPLGCLQDWLVENTASFQTFYKMAKSITRGISHLHTQIIKGDLTKPCICHRDLNSRNILVKPDLTCCICDFGFALKTFGSRYEYKGEMTLAETKSINEVGTLRYMAPEILEGAVNLRDCESALKQIDIYALGLMIWEIAVRCHDFYSTNETAPYKSPYEEEIGKHPSFEQMQVLVSRHKARPQFPLEWGGCQASKILKDICEDCWDHDAEARLTSLCVEERLQEIYSCRPIIAKKQTSPLNSNTFTQSVANNSPNKTNNILVFTPNSINLISAPPNQIISNGYQNKLSDGITFVTSSNDFAPPLKNNEIHSPFQERNFISINKQNQILIDKMRKHNFNDSESSIRIDKDTSTGELIAPTTSQSSHSTSNKLKGWNNVKAILEKKIFRKIDQIDEKSNLVNEKLNDISCTTPTKIIKIQKNTNNESSKTVHGMNAIQRPKNLNIQSSHGIKYSNNAEIIISPNQNPNNFNAKSPSKYSPNDIAIVCGVTKKINNNNFTSEAPRIVLSKSANAVKNLSSIDVLNEKQIKRQRSLEIFREVFNSRGSCERLRDPSQRVKTPGDVPASVRKIRASKTLSLYDDRMMDTSGGNTL